MSFTSTEVQIPTDNYALCCCCLELPCLKNLWTEYVWMEHTEVYGQMLKECFNLNWPQNEKNKEQICEVCITQLRCALQFKQRVVQSQERLAAGLIDLKLPFNGEIIQQEVSANKECTEVTDKELILPDDKNIEMLPDDDDYVYSVESDHNDDIDDDTKVMKTEQMNVECNKIDRVNKKCKRRVIIVPKKKRNKIEFRKFNYIKPRQNVCLILENSTLVPFKSSKGYFSCLYCNIQHVAFDELKAHVSQYHENITFKDILKSILRPHDRVKADVSDITCKICKERIDNLEMLVSHLCETHNVKFDFDSSVKPANSILPYDLGGGKFKCYICKNEFLFFKTLSYHMNSHSNDYVCDICGRCFLLPERLRAHLQMHIDVKSVKCEICGKICASNILLKSHIRHTHKKLSFMCSLCNETFTTYRLRMKHLEIVHNKAPLNLTCKICSKKYTSPSSLNSHMRKEHLKIVSELKHSCSICGMMFKSSNALSCHAIVHSGEKKFECEVCHKKYARSKSLTEHLKIHSNDRRWSCRACAQAFVQKCSLKNHIRVHHTDSDFEQLIVYKKPGVE